MRTVFFVSESTGLTAEAMGQSLLSQFETLEFERVYLPYINTVARARALLLRIAEARQRHGVRPIIFGTLLDNEIRTILQGGDCLYIEMFDIFMTTLSEELGVPPSRRSGRSHAITQPGSYTKRIDAINFAMANDDGVRPENFDHAEVILIGVSRVGKTPTSMYLAVHFGLRAANYPLTDEDFERGALPPPVMRNRAKLVGLTIAPERLHRIREERRRGSPYASLPQCQSDVRNGLRVLARLGVPVIDTSSHSIEEIASHVIEIFKEYN